MTQEKEQFLQWSAAFTGTPETLAFQFLYDVSEGGGLSLRTVADGPEPTNDVVEVWLAVTVGVGIAQLHVMPSQRITTRMLRSLPLAAMEREAFHHAQRLARASDPVLGPFAASFSAFASWDPARPGRVGRPDVDYASIAAQYVELLSQTEPLKRLAEALYVSASQARNILYEARSRGLLTAASPGRAGGQLTEKATALLAEAGR